MNVTLVDTSFLIALIRSNDAHHRDAVAWQKSIQGRLLTTEYVLIEFADACAPEQLRRRGVEVLREIRRAPEINIFPASTALMDEGLDLFSQRLDKRWSLTDCISFVVMYKEGLTDALTSDHHFEQAGFRALLRMKPPGT